MKSRNRTEIIMPIEQGHRVLHIWMDTSGLFGCGAVALAQREWLQWRWLICILVDEECVDGSIL